MTPVTSVPSLIRRVRPAAKASALHPSSISCSGGPKTSIWKKWSITQRLAKPAASAPSAIRPNVSPIAPWPFG